MTLKGILKAVGQKIRRNPIKSGVATIALVAYYFCLQSPLFDKPYATVVESSTGELLAARIATDGQWRFPTQDSVPEKFERCITLYEDRHFYRHFGFNPVAMANAAYDNFKAGRTVRGGSTLTQQVIRLSRSQNRNYFEKFIELILATRLEFRHSKEEILALYAAHAPFGGNVVGLDMAAWRYFGVRPHQLSWAESATLAVLPNAPGLIFPGRNSDALKRKRDRLLARLHQSGIIDKATLELAIAEPLPEKPYPLPQIAPHLLHRLGKTQSGKRLSTTIDASLQARTNDIVARYYQQYKTNEVHNLCVLVVDVKTRNVLAYVGNSPTDKNHGKDVDIIGAPRSTGSVLKPLLYASMLDAGDLLPEQLVADVPTQISGYSPQNFNMTYDGAVPASAALSRSLNIPSVLMLKDFGVYRFYDRLRELHLSHITKPPNHYGLSLILGGAESSLWDLVRAYSAMTSTLNHFNTNNAEYRSGEFTDLNLISGFKRSFGKPTFDKPVLGAASIYLTYQAMKEVNRPQGDEAWKFYDSSLEIAWKTGTSFGNRDAWAIGTNSRYVVGVWVGNASGEGRPGLTGVESAAPVLFDVFNLLPRSGWFTTPLNDLQEVSVCTRSGFLAGEYCQSKNVLIPLSARQAKVCKYHKPIHLDKNGWRVTAECETADNMNTRNWFVLPPVMEWYYKAAHVDYEPLPAYRTDCAPPDEKRMDFIYPQESGKIYLTKDFDGQVQPVVVKVAYMPKEPLFWYLNGKFFGQTKIFHEMPVKAGSGRHYLTVVNRQGQEINRWLEIVAP